MSTRAAIILKDDYEKVYFYRHSDGYLEGTLPSLEKFLELIKKGKIRDNVSQSAGWLVILGAIEYQTIKGKLPKDFEKFEPEDWKVGAYEPMSENIPSDVEYIYTIDLAKKEITHEKAEHGGVMGDGGSIAEGKDRTRKLQHIEKLEKRIQYLETRAFAVELTDEEEKELKDKQKELDKFESEHKLEHGGKKTQEYKIGSPKEEKKEQGGQVGHALGSVFEKAKGLAKKGFKGTKEAIQNSEKDFVLDYLRKSEQDVKKEQKEILHEARRIVSGIPAPSEQAFDAKDLVGGEKYYYLLEPGVKMIYKEFSYGKYFFKEDKILGKKIALTEDEVRKHISKVAKKEDGGYVNGGGIWNRKITPDDLI